MSSVGNPSPLELGGTSLRAQSYSAVDSHLSPNSSLDSSYASSSSASTIASSSSSTSTITPPEPVSPSSSGLIPLWKTLVRPRPWRFVQRSRVGGSLDRERARQEDTSLEGDELKKEGESEVGSGEDGDVFTNVENSQTSARGGRLTGPGSSADAVSRTKSESDIALRKAAGERRQVGFKTKAERFSLKDNRVSQPRPTTMNRSQTLPPSGRSSLSKVPAFHTLPREPSLVDSAKRGRSSNRTPDGPKTVTFSEPEKVELSPAKSDKSADSPSRNITLNVQESIVKVTFSKPMEVVFTKPDASEKPPTTNTSIQNNPDPEKPEVPAKPARLLYNGVTPTASLTATTQTPPLITNADTKKQTHSSSSGLKSSSCPVENMLFSIGFAVADEAHKTPEPKPTANKSQVKPEVKPKTTVNRAVMTSEPAPGPTQREEVRLTDPLCNPESEDTVLLTNSEVVRTNNNLCKQDMVDSKDFSVTITEPPAAAPNLPEPKHLGVVDKTAAKPKDKDIVPKKMIRIKGDKKTEEKAAKAKKKEQKGKEKDQKSKKSPTSDAGEHEKSRIKLFPWKVEFSAKDKSHCADTTSSVQKGKDVRKNRKDPKKGKHVGKEMSTPPAASVATAAGVSVQEKPQTVEQFHLAAPPKKSDKGDGAGSSSHSSNNNNSTKPHDKKSPSTPTQELLQEEEKRQRDQQQQLQQQQQQQEQHEPVHRQTTPSPQPSHLHAPPTHQHQLQLQQPPRQSTPRPRFFDDVSSSDQNSDLDSWYGSLPRRNPGKSVRICESDGEGDLQGSRGQGGKRSVPRRHTVGGAQIREHMQLVQDTDRKREAFYEMLATRYPQYADKITGLAAYPNQPTSSAERVSRPREPQRRRATVVTHGAYSSRPMDYDDPGTMSDVELSSFQRGGYARASLPIVRSASTSLERPIGLVFLVYRDETKKALLPNEITSLDTVRALFVRAFPEKLSMEFLDSPKRKIYILEAATSIFFQLEDLRDIQDRTVLKIHECDSVEPQHVRCQIEIRGRATNPARPSSRQGFVGESGPHFHDEMAKSQSLPAQNYQDLLQKERAQWEMEQEYIQAQLRRSRSRSVTPEPADRPRSLSTGPPRSRYSHSPDCLPTPDRGPPHLNPIPENPRLLANGFRQAAVNGGHYESGGHPHGLPPTGHQHPPAPGRVLSPPPVGQPVYESLYQAGSYPHPQAYVTHSTRAPLPQGPQRATGPPPPDMRGNNRGGPPQRHSLNFGAMSNPVYESFPQRSQSYRTTPERDALPPRPHSTAPHDMSRMERMEAQIASLAAWVHQVQTSPVEAPPQRRNSSRSTSSAEGTDTYPGSSASSLSDIPAAYSARQPVVTSDMRDKINDMQCRMRELRVELQGLRRMEQLNQESMRDAFTDTLSKIKKVISAVPGAENQVIRQQRVEVNSLAEAYRQDKARVEKELSDLETSVEELKEDVIARKCRVNISDVEGLALVLSNITKSLADLKARFPQVNESLRKVMTGEMEIVVKEERFIKEEPLHIEASLKRCKKLTSTLYTLKRLATVQDTRPLQVPSMAMECKEVGDEEKMAILESIRAMVPDHETRVQSLEAAESSRERKKKIITQQESLKFTKSLQTASKSLKPPDTQPTITRPSGDGVSHGDKDSKKSVSGGEVLDSKRSEPPVIPAKPARLMLTSESKPAESCSVVSVASSRPVAHTVTVTSQMCSEVEKKETDSKPGHRSFARSAFFGSLETSPPSSQSDRVKSSSKTSPTATVSASGLPVSSGSSHSKPVSGVYYQAASPTKTRSLSSSSSRSDSHDDSSNTDKGRKVPPPPPPRKSSAKYPYGIGPLSPQSPSENGGSGGPALHRQNSGEKSPDKSKKAPVLTVYKAHSPTSSGPLSSTPKPATPQKPQGLNKVAGQRSSVKRGETQQQKMAPDRLLSTFVSPVPAAITTNSQDPIDEGDLSGSESTGSTTSLDSQQGATLLRSNSSPSHRPPKPNPPQRQSSLGSKESQDSGTKTKTQILQDRVKKSHQAGSVTTQVNGLDGAKVGHKT